MNQFELDELDIRNSARKVLFNELENSEFVEVGDCISIHSGTTIIKA